MHARTLSEQTGRNDARIVDNQKFVAAKQTRKLGEKSVFESPRCAIQQQESRRLALVQRALGDPFSREMVVKFVQTHARRQSNSNSDTANKPKRIGYAEWVVRELSSCRREIRPRS